jgi:hypothetical protein
MIDLIAAIRKIQEDFIFFQKGILFEFSEFLKKRGR